MPPPMSIDSPKPITSTDFNICPRCKEKNLEYSFNFDMHADGDLSSDVRVTEPVICHNCKLEWEDTWLYDGRVLTKTPDFGLPKGVK